MSYFLRELDADDISEINLWRNDREIIDSLGGPYRYISQTVDEAWIGNYLKNRENCVRLAICLKETKQIIGACYLLNLNWVNRNAEFAIWIGSKATHGKGAGTYATTEVLKHAFNDLNLHRVYLTALDSNVKAIGLYKKIGFVEEGIARDAVFKNGEYKNLIQMAILKNNFISALKVER